ncbi:hypothetical protein LCGC14_2496660, partial [marine sediment metagenome]
MVCKHMLLLGIAHTVQRVAHLSFVQCQP